MQKFETGDDKVYKVEIIQNNIVYTKEVDKHLLKLCYLVVWKKYLKEKNI